MKLMPNTIQSKLHRFIFAGEIADVDGVTGGLISTPGPAVLLHKKQFRQRCKMRVDWCYRNVPLIQTR